MDKEKLFLKECFSRLRKGIEYKDKGSIDNIFNSLGYAERHLVLACWEIETGTVYQYNDKKYDADYRYIRENEDIYSKYKSIIK